MSLEKQPIKQDVDMTRETSGNYVFECFITVWPYSGFKKEETYAEKTTLRIRAMGFNEATEKANIACRAISLVHQVWRVNLDGVMKQ